LTSDGPILLFHPDDPWVFKEIKSHLENYSFQIHMKWAVVNSLPLASLEDRSLKLWALVFSFPFLHSFPTFLSSNIVWTRMLETLLNQVTLLVKALDPSSFSMSSYCFSSPSEDL
jgi:hypothetical protein